MRLQTITQIHISQVRGQHEKDITNAEEVIYVLYNNKEIEVIIYNTRDLATLIDVLLPPFSTAQSIFDINNYQLNR